MTGMMNGAPLFVRKADNAFTLANTMRMHLYSALGALKCGLDILLKEEGVKVDEMLGHGGFFKTPKAGQSIAAAAIDAPVSVMETAGEGGAWGIALLAAYANCSKDFSLQDYLDNKIFAGNKGTRLNPTPEDVAGFEKFIEKYKAGLEVEAKAVELL